MDVLLHIEMLVMFALEMKDVSRDFPRKASIGMPMRIPFREEGVSLGSYY